MLSESNLRCLVELELRNHAILGEIFERLDGKIGIILGFALVSIVELLGFLILVVAEPQKPRVDHPYLAAVLFVGALSSTLLSSLVCMTALRPLPFLTLPPASKLRTMSTEEKGMQSILLEELIARNRANAYTAVAKTKMVKTASEFVAGALLYYGLLAAMLFLSAMPIWQMRALFLGIVIVAVTLIFGVWVGRRYSHLLDNQDDEDLL